MTEDFELELSFPANVKIRGKDNNFNAIIVRKVDGKTFPVAALKNLTAAECYTRLGAVVPKEEIPAEEGLSRAKKTLSDALTAISGRAMISSAEMQDALLDAINDLGAVEEQTK